MTGAIAVGLKLATLQMSALDLLVEKNALGPCRVKTALEVGISSHLVLNQVSQMPLRMDGARNRSTPDQKLLLADGTQSHNSLDLHTRTMATVEIDLNLAEKNVLGHPFEMQEKIVLGLLFQVCALMVDLNPQDGAHQRAPLKLPSLLLQDGVRTLFHLNQCPLQVVGMRSHQSVLDLYEKTVGDLICVAPALKSKSALGRLEAKSLLGLCRAKQALGETNLAGLSGGVILHHRRHQRQKPHQVDGEAILPRIWYLLPRMAGMQNQNSAAPYLSARMTEIIVEGPKSTALSLERMNVLGLFREGKSVLDVCRENQVHKVLTLETMDGVLLQETL
jgi:hypothetical protein